MRAPIARGRFGIGMKVGPYNLLEFLRQGAFGEVWLAELDSTLARSRHAARLPLHAAVDLASVRREAEVWVRALNPRTSLAVPIGHGATRTRNDESLTRTQPSWQHLFFCEVVRILAKTRPCIPRRPEPISAKGGVAAA
jgi:hypothetical protein